MAGCATLVSGRRTLIPAQGQAGNYPAAFFETVEIQYKGVSRDKSIYREMRVFLFLFDGVGDYQNNKLSPGGFLLIY
ncbi:MAG: hypothetical protein RSE29_02470 [Leclercia sp.]